MRSHHWFHVEAGGEARTVDRVEVGGIGHGQDEGLGLANTHRQDGELVGQAVGDEPQHLGRHLQRTHIDLGHARLFAEEVHQHFLGDIAEGHEVAPQAAPGNLLVGDGTLELRRRDEAALHEQLSQPLDLLLHRGSGAFWRSLEGHMQGNLIQGLC